MGYHVKIKKNAKKDLPKLKAAGLNRKFDELLNILKENPYQTLPTYEKLVGLPLYSRRINIQHRLVYRVDELEQIVTIESVWSHYEKIRF